MHFSLLEVRVLLLLDKKQQSLVDLSKSLKSPRSTIQGVLEKFRDRRYVTLRPMILSEKQRGRPKMVAKLTEKGQDTLYKIIELLEKDHAHRIPPATAHPNRSGVRPSG